MNDTATRTALRDCKRLVVKIGSRALCADGGRFAQVAEQVATQVKAGRKVVLVSSGAVALGRERLGLSERPKKISLLQAAAATGQSLLMRAYEDAFEPLGIHVAQVLLTHDAVTDRDRYLHARQAIDELLKLGVVPIINENDTVSIDELRFGDNDQLAAMVCTLVGADLLVLLSDVVGILDDQGRAHLAGARGRRHRAVHQTARRRCRPWRHAVEGGGGASCHAARLAGRRRPRGIVGLSRRAHAWR